MKKKDFQKGAISVFLVIILIPCIVISGMFVDLSRVKLSQGVATSSADLALNSLMANYDKDLSEFYGLMASCQNIEDFYEQSAQFFLEALYSQGLNADDAESLMTYISTLMNDETIHDLFQMEIQTETKDIVNAYKGSNSTEASLGTSSVIMKDQIVEFMKYRAPIQISSKVIERLKKTGASDIFNNAEEDEQLVKDKQEYADAEEAFMDAAFKTYKELLNYESKGMTAEKLKEMKADMKTARETYREVSSLMVSNFNGTSELKRFERPTYELDYSSYDETRNAVHSRKEKDDAGNYVYYIDGSKISSLLSDLEGKIEDFKSKREAVSNAAGDTLVNADIGTGDNQYHPIQWWKKVDSLINSSGIIENSPIENFKKSAEKMLDSYAKVLAIEKCTLSDDVPDDWKECYNYNSLTQSVVDLHKNFLKPGVKETGGNEGNRYLRLINKLEKHSEENINKIDPGNVKIFNGKTVTAAISDVNTTLSEHVTDLEDCIDILDDLIDGTLTNNPYSLDELSEMAKEYHNSYKIWSDNAKAQDTDMAKSDWKSIQEIENAGQVLDVSEQQIRDFKTRLVDIRSRLKDVKSTIENMKFADEELTDIDSYTKAYNAVKNNIGENLKNSAVSSKASSIFKDKFTPYSYVESAEVISYSFEDANFNPDLNVSKPEFYKWLKGKFGEIDESKVEKEKEKVNGKEGEGETEAENAKNKDRSSSVSTTNLYNNSETYAPADFPSGLDANGQFQLGSSLIASLGNVISSLVNMNFEGARDSLYSTEYVMDMFSYQTYENEGKYNLYKKTNGKPPTSTADYASVSNAWQSTKITDTYNQTLTNVKINSTNNILFGAEVEYILYGKENKSNVTSAYVDIFEIRYILNTLSGFQNFWTVKSNTGKAINLAASTISTATSGIIPIPAIKCVAILLLTALETAKDLDRLQDGFPVEVYKKEDEWVFSIDENLSTSSKTGKNCENGLFYSDYIYLFLYLGFENESSASEMYRRIGDLIQVNMRKYTGKNTYMLKNSRSYFELNAKIRVKPLMLALPVSQGFSNNPKDKNDWCTFEIHEIRGYS